MGSVILVGHCGPDMFMLKSAIGRFVPDSSIEVVNDEADLDRFVNSDHVLLVNRVLDGRFPSTSGIDLIRRVSAGDEAPQAMLISNYEDAQAEAVGAGGRLGFGKSDLYAESTGEALREAVAG